MMPGKPNGFPLTGSLPSPLITRRLLPMRYQKSMPEIEKKYFFIWFFVW
jgi:hypothetical protein